ncbi:hypothetical protein SteCoe_33124 [Stentor coeruleus]|uniref:PPM-type phosphatase domain-containing protein n=1 Tax=Stentor coeruleus TaxID=5963 RepID=A0A1R2AXJ5_9CILI|nr:hypothetical protein SteCoe_33124 [Stentor coeruleus]
MNLPHSSRSKSSHLLLAKSPGMLSPYHSITQNSHKAQVPKIFMPLTTRSHISSEKLIRFSEKPRVIKSTYIPSYTRTTFKDQKLAEGKNKPIKSNEKIAKTGKVMLKVPSILWTAKNIWKNAKKIIPKKSLIANPRNSLIRMENCVKCLIAKTSTGTACGKPKPHNQDCYITIENFRQAKHESFFGVFDGHGLFGHEVSSYVRKAYPACLEKYLGENSNFHLDQGPVLTPQALADFPDILKKICFSMQSALINHPHIDVTYSGTTAVTVYLHGKTCICANVGDSRAIIGRFTENWEFAELSSDHKPDTNSEKMRIEAAGGRVEPYFDSNSGTFVGPNRVWVKNQPLPGLAMSRSLGDFLASSVGVISEPDVFIHNIEKEDKFLLLASDGIWEALDNLTCIKIVGEYYEEGNIQGAARMLLEMAEDVWNKRDNYVDDITFIIVFF